MRVKIYGIKTFICPSAWVYFSGAEEKNMKLLNILFDIKSSSNIIDKYRLAQAVAPFGARYSFFIFGVLKTILLIIKNKLIGLR